MEIIRRELYMTAMLVAIRFVVCCGRSGRTPPAKKQWMLHKPAEMVLLIIDIYLPPISMPDNAKRRNRHVLESASPNIKAR
eukprot:scaffold129829_cov15-Prasinocladus_malaysianus.AAC.1